MVVVESELQFGKRAEAAVPKRVAKTPVHVVDA